MRNCRGRQTRAKKMTLNKRLSPILSRSLRVRDNMIILRETHCLSHFYNIITSHFRDNIGESHSCNAAQKQTKPCFSVYDYHIILVSASIIITLLSFDNIVKTHCLSHFYHHYHIITFP